MSTTTQLTVAPKETETETVQFNYIAQEDGAVHDEFKLVFVASIVDNARFDGNGDAIVALDAKWGISPGTIPTPISAVVDGFSQWWWCNNDVYKR